MRVLKVRTTDGLSLFSTLIRTWAGVAWMSYGLTQGDMTQVLVNLQSVAGTALILVGFVAFAQVPMRRQILCTVVMLGLLALLYVVAGRGALAVAGGVLGFGGVLPQMWKSFREPGGEGISIASLLFSVSCSFCWVAFGVVHNDLFVVFNASFGAFLMIVILAFTCLGRKSAKASSRSFDVSVEVDQKIGSAFFPASLLSRASS